MPPLSKSETPTATFATRLHKLAFKNVWTAVMGISLTVIFLTIIYFLLSFMFNNADWTKVIDQLRFLAVYQYPENLLWRPFVALMLLIFVLGIFAGLSSYEVGRYIFYTLAITITLITVIALYFFPSVRWLWCGVVLSGMTGLTLAQISPKMIGQHLNMIVVVAWLLAVLSLMGFVKGEEHLLRFVGPRYWGGILLSLFLPITACLLATPLASVVCLGRQSRFFSFRLLSKAYIGLFKAVPIVVWLLAFHILMAPLFTRGIKIEPVIRAQLAFIFFAAAHMADFFYLSARLVPKEQLESAKALGLSNWTAFYKINFPQVFRATVPDFMLLFARLFRDTTLLMVVGVLDFFALFVGAQNQNDPQFLDVDITHEMFFAVLVFYGSVSFLLHMLRKYRKVTPLTPRNTEG